MQETQSILLALLGLLQLEVELQELSVEYTVSLLQSFVNFLVSVALLLIQVVEKELSSASVLIVWVKRDTFSIAEVEFDNLRWNLLLFLLI